MSDRSALERRALRLVAVTAAWNLVEGGGALISGVLAHSIALIGFGLDSLVEVFASGVAAWQLARPRAREARAVRLIGGAFVVVAVYIAVESVLRLVHGHRPDRSVPGIIVAALAVMMMSVLGVSKRRLGRRMKNAAIEAEARFSLIDAALSGSVLIGLVLTMTLDWWWADAVVALIVSAIAMREGIEGLRGR